MQVSLEVLEVGSKMLERNLNTYFTFLPDVIVDVSTTEVILEVLAMSLDFDRKATPISASFTLNSAHLKNVDVPTSEVTLQIR